MFSETIIPASAPPKVTGVDWSLGVTASSSELQAVGTTFVQLRVQTESADNVAEYVHLGMCARTREAVFCGPSVLVARFI